MIPHTKHGGNMDLQDLEYETRRQNEELDRKIRRLEKRLDEVIETVGDLKATVNDIINGDDVS